MGHLDFSLCNITLFFYLILYNYLIMNVVYLNRNVNIKISSPNISLSSKNKAGGKNFVCASWQAKDSVLYEVFWSKGLRKGHFLCP